MVAWEASPLTLYLFKHYGGAKSGQWLHSHLPQKTLSSALPSCKESLQAVYGNISKPAALRCLIAAIDVAMDILSCLLLLRQECGVTFVSGSTQLLKPHHACETTPLSNQWEFVTKPHANSFCTDKWNMHFGQLSLVGGLRSWLTSSFRKLNSTRHLQLNGFRELCYEYEKYFALAYNFSLRGLIHPDNIQHYAPLLEFEFLSYDLSMLKEKKFKERPPITYDSGCDYDSSERRATAMLPTVTP